MNAKMSLLSELLEVPGEASPAKVRELPNFAVLVAHSSL
jgi:hypothetical protein